MASVSVISGLLPRNDSSVLLLSNDRNACQLQVIVDNLSGRRLLAGTEMGCSPCTSLGDLA